MQRWTITATLVLLLGLMGGCSQQEAEVDLEQQWADFMSAYNELEATEDKVALIEEFLATHADTEYAGRLAGAIAYYRGEEMGDPEGALALLDTALEANTDPETRFEIATAMFPLSAEIGEPMDLAAVAEELAAVRPLSFVERIDISDLAVEHGQWETGAAYAEAALDTATADDFLADYPDEDYTREEAEAKAARRKVMSLANLGWARWNLGQSAEAMAAFAEAAPLDTVGYLGVSDLPLDLYRGKALLASGDAEGAIELLTPKAVLGSNDEAMETLREAFAVVNDDEAEFDDFVWSERQRLARTIDDFSLADYSGEMHDFSALSDGKVTLLAFWFPT